MPKFIAHFLIIAFILNFIAPSVKAEELLTWQDCIKEAAKNHPDLISSLEVVKQSEASKKITASALFPQVDGNLKASTAKTYSSTTKTASSADAYTYGASATQLIFDGYKTVDDVKAAAEDIKAAKQSYRFTSSQVRLRLRTAFVNLLEAQEMLRITEEIFKIRRENLELITLRYESGLEHKGALLTAEANLAEAKFDIIQAQRDLEVAQRQLTKEMGRDKLTPMQVRATFKVNDSAKVKPDFEILAKNNPSLQQLIAQKNSAEFGVKSAYANFFPTLSGQAGANKNDAHWLPKGDQWNLGLTLSMPIFEGGLRNAEVAQAQALLNQLRADERSTRDGILFTLEQTWAALQDAIEEVEVQKKLLLATQVRSEIAQAQYSIGFISFDNWTIIEDNLVAAKKSYLNAQANALITEANWVQAKGETLEYAD